MGAKAITPVGILLKPNLWCSQDHRLAMMNPMFKRSIAEVSVRSARDHRCRLFSSSTAIARSSLRGFGGEKTLRWHAFGPGGPVR